MKPELRKCTVQTIDGTFEATAGVPYVDFIGRRVVDITTVNGDISKPVNEILVASRFAASTKPLFIFG